MIAVDDRNFLSLRPYVVRLLQAATAAASGNAGPAASAQQRAPRRLHLRWADRALFIWLYRRYPRILDAVTIVRPETVVRWHRMGFAAYWRWKSRPLGGRPRIGKEVRDLIRRISFENPLWGAPKIHGELLKPGIEAAQFTVSIYMVPRSDRPLQTWKTFIRNHMEGIAAIDLFVVSTIAFPQPDGGVAGASNHRSIPLGQGALRERVWDGLQIERRAADDFEDFSSSLVLPCLIALADEPCKFCFRSAP
jgi:hypothetical protein